MQIRTRTLDLTYAIEGHVSVNNKMGLSSARIRRGRRVADTDWVDEPDNYLYSDPVYKTRR